MGFFNLCLYLLLMNTTTFVVLFAESETSVTMDSNDQIAVKIGLIFDFDSSTGYMANSCISLALSDFYSKNQHYTTRLALYSKNSSDVLTAVLAALELVNQDQVVAIIGPQYANEARLVAEIGGRSQVPIVSLSLRSLPHWPSKTPYFVQTTLPDSIQLEGITSLVQQLGWDEIIVIYEDDTEESGNYFIPALIDAFQKASIHLSYAIAISFTSSVSDHIKKELSDLRSIQTRVFLVHVTTPGLASQLFSLANEVGMMTTGTAWIITDALCNSLSSLDATTIESMEGVLGVRPYVPRSKNMQEFEIRWNELQMRQKQLKYTEIPSNDFNMFCLWAYEAVWSLATSVENIQLPGLNRSHEKLNASSAAITNLRVSDVGPRLVKEILETRLQGLSGESKVKDGQLETPVLEIINMVGNGENGDRTVGYWTPGRGFSRKIASASEGNHGIVYSKQLDGVLKPIIWPGDSINKPKGWDVPGMGLKLRVGVPEKTGFTEFVNVQKIGNTKIYNVTGFSIDVFKAALDSLPFRLEPEFIPVLIGSDSGGTNRTYDNLVNKLSGTKNLEFEALVGDITIRANREREVDFSLPYTESGVVMVVKAEPDRLKDIWMFIAPLSWDLWLTIFLATIFIGLVLRMLERRVNPQGQLGMLFLFPLAALVFPDRNMVGSNWARFVLVVWLFMAYILMQSYTANLSSILTVGQLKPSAGIACAGYQQGSFVKDFLTNWLNMDLSKCYGYSSMEEYDRALSLGCKHGGVDAIFDEIPYIRLFLHQYGSKYKMVGTPYNTGGFGFAFPIGSPLSKPISKAILELRESGIMQNIEKRYFDVGNTSYYDAEDASQEDPRFTSLSFAGLFIIAAFFTLLALVCSECSFAMSRYRVHSFEMTHDVPLQNDLQLQDHQKEDDEIIAEEERK
ncbi:Glutamate receptor [Heracleum sosnowskyi]|uniref:Glutamate receptor n=1 Tax=Heracleum sosnowskyi TaxID=360622 RepID=A0AAD8J8G7_9APIA|nr:Glutamate receptor [Heracleum sosnowskyi]